MTTKPTCPYCAKPISGRAEREHVFPRSWYPYDTLSTGQRPTVPSCATCNRALGAVEERLRRTLSLVVNPDHPNGRGVRERARRAFDPSLTNNEREKRARKRVADDVRSRIVYAGPSEIPTAPIGFQPPPRDHVTEQGLVVHGHKLIAIDRLDLAIFATKLVRGMYCFTTNGECLPSDAQIGASLVDFSEFKRFVQQLRDIGGGPFGVPPGLVWAGGPVKGTNMSAWGFEIWGQLRIAAQSHGADQFKFIGNLAPMDPPIAIDEL